jgi:molybdopterin synthase catalytic subunit
VSVRVQSEDFEIGAEVARLTAGRTDIGAIVTFTGAVRADNDGSAIAGMTLEHYPGMTEQELARVEAEAATRWPLQASLIVHRVGTLKPGDNIVLVVTASAHREAAFDAAAFLMDYLKTRAPFWKKEVGPDGKGQWVDARDSDDHAAERWESDQQPSGDETASTEGSPRRFSVTLLIWHPTIDPAKITAELGLEAHFAHRVGQPRMTPKGTPLPGNYRDTRWSHIARYEVTDQLFADTVTALIGRLKPRKAFLADLKATGGNATVIIRFLEDKHYADNIDRDTLAQLADLQLDLGIESFGVPQS